MKDFKLTFTNNTTYYGKDAEGFYSTALLEASTAKNFRLIPNVKSKIKLASLDMGTLLQDESCSFSNTGEGTLAQKSFEVCSMKVNLAYCVNTLETSYLSELMRAGSNNSDIPATVEAYLLEQVAKKIAQDLEYYTWVGTGVTQTSLLTCDNGLQKQLLADASVVDVTSSALTISNIVTAISKVYDALPTTVRTKEDLAIFMNPKAASLYRQSLAAASAEAYYRQDLPLTFLGVEIIVANGLGDNKMVAGAKSNFVLLTDLVSDFEEINIIPQRAISGAPEVRFTAHLKYAVGYLVGSEIVYFN